eukprot:746901-Hanusia_phi.AAC.3
MSQPGGKQAKNFGAHQSTSESTRDPLRVTPDGVSSEGPGPGCPEPAASASMIAPAARLG